MTIIFGCKTQFVIQLYLKDYKKTYILINKKRLGN